MRPPVYRGHRRLSRPSTVERVRRDRRNLLEDSFHADGRDESISPPLLSAAVRNNMLRKFLQPGPGDVVLDLGCGSGRFAIWNLDSGAHFIGIDTGRSSPQSRARTSISSSASFAGCLSQMAA